MTTFVSWSLEELKAAFAHHCALINKAAQTGDWSEFPGLFTEDAVYIEHSYGTFHGREQISQWITNTMTTFPGNQMTSFPVNWVTYDAEAGRVICELDNPMRDPGDGSQIGATNLTILTYAGENRWQSQEDVYNPMRFLNATKKWVRIAIAHDNLPADASDWVKDFAG
ncbi:MAG TPA: nuclear transport factor 2 family protein [Marmoricola sp.]|nr:nuclear transport factor 2 family protein [Marmoricola sp.]HNJ78625.1 nuclear transport factor 2 family protein [Marmoricola sp.]